MKSLWRLKHYLRPHLWMIVTSALLAIPLSALRASPAALVKYIGDHLLTNHDYEKLRFFPILFIGLYILNFIVRFGHYYLLRFVIARVNQKLKNDLYSHLLGLSADYFTAQTTGTLISRVAVDTQFIDGGLAALNILVREPITFLFLFGYALRLNWRLTLITLLIFPPLGWVFATTGRNLKRYITKMSEENARLYSSLQETFTGIRVIKTFRLENYVKEKFLARSQNFTKFLLKTAVLEEVSHPMVELLTSFIIAAIIYYGGSQVFQGKMTSGDLLAIFTTFALMMNPIRMLNDVNIKISQAAAACDRIFQIFDWKSNLHDPDSPMVFQSFEREISLNQVSFSYPDSPTRMVLKEISFTIPRGSVVALVGASGSGKSSLVGLLPRIFDVTHGGIQIDGHDIREYTLDSLRKHIAIVTQDVFLFNDTIEENIRCGRLSATSEEIREAARRAHALDFIELAPQGFQSVIGDRGQKLSGGERQRLSIARAFLRAAPILVLDEATSSLDSASERAVQGALDELMKDRTTLIIAHRLSTIKHADHILVLRDGVVIEQGRHLDLMKLGGEYASFHEVAH